MQTLLRILFAIVLPLSATACMWDADSLSREKSRSHDLAETILNTNQVAEDTNKLQERIKTLEANRREDDADWWNNLAAAYARLNHPEIAVKLLEPVIGKFPNDYGMHANLGTAYHLLGRYQEAEKEIARDLEINSDAHFGLEKYHLALLQYLVRDQKYQSRHVYVDEFSIPFVLNEWTGDFCINRSFRDDEFKTRAQSYLNIGAADEAYKTIASTNQNSRAAKEMLATVVAMDTPPAYRSKWELNTDTNFEAGVIYMAQMNPREPSCMTMLGIAAWRKRDYHLAAVAFDKAIAMGSPQASLLKDRGADLQEFIARSEDQKLTGRILIVLAGVLVIGFLVLVVVAAIKIFQQFARLSK